MAPSFRYSSEYAWAGPVQIRGFDANLALLRWFFQHSQVAGGLITFDYLAKSDGEIDALKAAVPDLGTPLRDLNSFRTILYHLSSHQRFTDEQVVQIGNLVVGWPPRLWMSSSPTARLSPLTLKGIPCCVSGQGGPRPPSSSS